MTIKNIRGWFAMLTVALLTVFVFTACEDNPVVKPPPTDPDTIKVLPVGTISAGQTDDDAITFQWTASPSSDSSWFRGYQIILTNQQGNVGYDSTHGKDILSIKLGGLDVATTYTFKVVAIGTNPGDNQEVKSTAKEIKWGLATHFIKNDNNAPIKVYVKESSSYGSGLNLYSVYEAPSTWKVASGANWNLALGSKSELIFGTASSVASKVSYNLTGTPADAEITDPIDWDTDNLADLKLSQDLSTFTYSKKYIDLNSSVATSKLKGLVFFAKLNNHYAKIIVVKKDGKYLQDETSSDPYVQVLVSYQKRAGVPYAKPSF